MRVNINGTWYDSSKMPIQLELTDDDKQNIAKMALKAKNFIVYPSKMDFKEVCKTLNINPQK